jgi:hypothetical protein
MLVQVQWRVVYVFVDQEVHVLLLLGGRWVIMQIIILLNFL